MPRATRSVGVIRTTCITLCVMSSVAAAQAAVKPSSPPAAPPTPRAPVPESFVDGDSNVLTDFDDFDPNHVLTFFVAPGEEECFYEEVIQARTDGAKLHGAYFVSAGGDLSIDTSVSRDSDPPVHTSTKAEGLFIVPLTYAGTYKVCFLNRAGAAESKTVTLAIDTKKMGKDDKPAALQQDSTEVFRSRLTTIEDNVANFRRQITWMEGRWKRHTQTQQSTSDRVMYFTVLESVLVVSITGAQVWFLRSLVNSRQWV